MRFRHVWIADKDESGLARVETLIEWAFRSSESLEPKIKKNVYSHPRYHFLDAWVSRLTMRYRPFLSSNPISLNSSFTMFATNIFFLCYKLVYPRIFWRLTAYEKLWGYREGILSLKGTSGVTSLAILSPPWHLSLSEFKFIDLKAVPGLALFVGCFFSYLRIIFLSFFPHGQYGCQNIPSYR